MRNLYSAIVFICMLIVASGVNAATVLVEPATQESPPAGEALTFGIKVEGVTDLYGYDILVIFDKTALKFTGIKDEGFLPESQVPPDVLPCPFPSIMMGWEDQEKPGQFVKFQDITPAVTAEVNLVGGILVLNGACGPVPGASGTGLLFTITFEVLKAKNSLLQLGNADYPVALVDSMVAPIDTDTVDGRITYIPNLPPVAKAGDDKTVVQGETITFDGSASSDSDGTIVSYLWDFGDGNTAEGVTVSHAYANVNSYTVTLTVTDDNGDTGMDTLTVDVMGSLLPVIREHSPDSIMLTLQAAYNEANVHGHTYVDIWKGSITIEAGMFLEFQIAMFSGNPCFQGSVDLHTTDGGNLRDSGAVDQNGISAHPGTDLSAYARDQWYHRMISLDALAGKTADGVMIATDSNEHPAGIFRAYVDNIQITDGEHILTAIYIDEDYIQSTGTDTATETTFAGTEGMSNYSVSLVGATPVTPAGKLISTWGSIKNGR